jgi:ABC-type multidrug transport system fused ATPase/permease subunit
MDYIRYRLFQNILQQEIEYFDVHSSGKLLNSLIDDMGKVKLIISNSYSVFLTFIYNGTDKIKDGIG